MKFSPTTISSLIGSVVSVLAVLGIAVNGEALNHLAELGFTTFYAVTNLVIYIRKIKEGNVSLLGARK